MVDIKDRIPFNLHPVSAWIMMAAMHGNDMSWLDLLYGWAYAIDGNTCGYTWDAICEAIESETRFTQERNFLNG